MAAVLAGEAASPRMRFLAPRWQQPACSFRPPQQPSCLTVRHGRRRGEHGHAGGRAAHRSGPAGGAAGRRGGAVRSPPRRSRPDRSSAPQRRSRRSSSGSGRPRRRPPRPSRGLVEQVAAPVRQIVADDRDSIGPKVAPTAERVRHEAAHARPATHAPCSHRSSGPRSVQRSRLRARRRPPQHRRSGRRAPAPTAETRGSQPAPAAPELPSMPSAGASAAPAGLAFAGFAALFGAVALLLAGAVRTLHLTPVAVRPAPFISLLERPG